MVSALAGLEDQELVLARLLRNQQDIGNAIKPYYGEAAGNKLGELLRDVAFDKGEDHIIMLADALTEGIVKQFPAKFK